MPPSLRQTSVTPVEEHHQDLGLCLQVSVSKDTVKQSPEECTSTLDSVLNLFIKVYCLREVGKVFNSLQDFPIDGDL